ALRAAFAISLNSAQMQPNPGPHDEPSQSFKTTQNKSKEDSGHNDKVANLTILTSTNHTQRSSITAHQTPDHCP
ncbi:hypothetical protein AVEN_158829-1, partial [Araneus ventricosus]